jgi:N-methylhydantoinase B
VTLISPSLPKAPPAFDPVLLAVLSNRMDSICREMTNTLLRTGRSTVLSVARDFSCSIVTGTHELLAAADGMPVHVFGSDRVTKSIDDLHDDIREGDAFLHNDPYRGNTHAADHTIVVPVFHQGEVLFYVCAKAHQADCGNALPTTYMPSARDVYEEGAIFFPGVKVQRNFEDVPDIMRICKMRIRHPEQWYGDYLATLGAARIGERRLVELLEKYSKEVVLDFVREWFDYSERLFVDAVSKLPTREITVQRHHDPFPNLPEGVPINMKISLLPEEGRIEVDLRHNIDCVPSGLNESETCAINNALTGVLNSFGEPIPCNAGMFRRVKVHLRENCVVGIPRFPTSVSMATTNLGDRLVNAGQSAVAEAAAGFGLAEGGSAMGPGFGVISGTDSRRAEPFVNELVLISNGGPGSPWTDGWLNYGSPVIAGMMYRDSVEIDEQKYPVLVQSMEVLEDTAGPGQFRGAPGQRVVYGPRTDALTVVYNIDGSVHPPAGVNGGGEGSRASAARITAAGQIEELPAVSVERIEPGEWIVGVGNSGGGYGSPLDRDTALVLDDVLEGLVSPGAARTVYGVVLERDDGPQLWAVDEQATERHRGELRDLASAGSGART